jgi:hypothetical protein
MLINNFIDKQIDSAKPRTGTSQGWTEAQTPKGKRSLEDLKKFLFF